MSLDIRATVLRLLGDIAPEADLTILDPDANLREQLDIDSLDFLGFIVKLHQELGVNIPESDYRRLLTLKGCLAYLAEKTRA